jgi:homoserine kinase
MSGAGSTVVAFATENCQDIAEEMKERFAASGAQARTLEASVDNRGRIVE